MCQNREINETEHKVQIQTKQQRRIQCIIKMAFENMTIQNLWDAAKPVLRGKFIAIQSHLKKQEKSQINNLNLHIKQLEKEEQKQANKTKLAEGKKS